MPYVILSACNPSLAVQGSSNAGGAVTLQPINTSNLLQLWDAFIQPNGQLWGLVWLNPESRLAMTFATQAGPVTMQPFVEGAGSNAFALGNTAFGASTAQQFAPTSLTNMALTANACQPGASLAIASFSTNATALWLPQFLTGN